ncbi:MAG: cyclase family protein [Methanobacterium sp.]|nr:cyclase family protein [Methanobacterium sp.]
MLFVTLSHMIDGDSPVHVALKKPEIVQNSSVSSGDGYNSYMVTLENHSGTHVDAPGHFLEDGRIISDYSPLELFFIHPLILDVPKNRNELIELKDVIDKDFNGLDCIFFRTGFESFRESEREKYLTENPGISPDVVLWIRESFSDIRCIGIDSVSMSGYKYPELGEKAHLNAFEEHENIGEPLLFIEDMKLNNIENDDLGMVLIVPWQLKGVDSAPCTVLAIKS